MNDDKKKPTPPDASPPDASPPNVAKLKADNLAAVEGLADEKPVAIEAGELRAIGAKVPTDVPDRRPVKITAGDVRKLCN